MLVLCQLSLAAILKLGLTLWMYFAVNIHRITLWYNEDIRNLQPNPMLHSGNTAQLMVLQKWHSSEPLPRKEKWVMFPAWQQSSPASSGSIRSAAGVGRNRAVSGRVEVNVQRHSRMQDLIPFNENISILSPSLDIHHQNGRLIFKKTHFSLKTYGKWKQGNTVCR